MALTVGELVAYIRADSSDFDRKVDNSGQKFSGLQRAVGTGVKTIATGFATATTAVAGLGIAATKVGIEYNSLRQTAGAALTTLTGSAENAADQMARLDEFGRTSWVMRDVLVTAQTQMIGFGIETEKVIPYLHALQEGVAAVGGSNQDYAELAELMARIAGQGKITAEELNQFGRRGIDAAGLIGEAMGKTGGEIREAISSGALDAEDALDALAESMSTKFAGATDNVRDTWDGAVANMAGAWRDFGAALAEPLVDPTGGGYLVTWANDVANAFWDLEAKTRPLVALLVDRFTPGLEAVSPALQSVAGAINSWDLSQVNRQLDEMAQYAPLIAGLGTALFSLGTQSVPILGAINPLVAGFAALAATSPEIRTMLGEFASSLSPLLPVLGEFAVLLADTALLVLSELTPAFSDLLVAGGDLISTLGMGLVPALGDLLVAATPLVTVMADLIGWVAELPPEMQAVGLAVAALTMGPLSDLVQTINGNVKAALQTLSEQTAVQQALAGTGEQATLMGTAAMNATGRVRGLGTALKTSLAGAALPIAITGIVAGLAAFVTSNQEAARASEELASTLDQTTGAITDQTEALMYQRLEDQIQTYVELGGAAEDYWNAALGDEAAMARVNSVWGDHAQILEEAHGYEVVYTGAARDNKNALEEEAAALEAAREATLRKAEVTGEGADVERDAAAATNEHREAQERLRDELNEGADTSLSAAEATLRYEDATRRTRDAVERKAEAEAEATRLAQDANATDEERSAAARDVERATSAVEQAILAEVRALENDLEAKARNNAASSELYEIMDRGRQSFIDQRIAMGDTREEAEALADAYGLIPDEVDTRFNLYGVQDAQREIDTFIDRNDNRQVRITLNTRQGQVTHFPGPGGGMTAMADGGIYDGTVKSFANGGIDHAGNPVARVPQIVQGGRNILWGEPETGWEAYISGKPGMRTRNLRVMGEAARRLGVVTMPMADGGTAGNLASVAARGGDQVTYQVHVHGVNMDHTDEVAKAVLRATKGVELGSLYGRPDTSGRR